MRIFGILLLMFSITSFILALIKDRLIEYRFFYFKLTLFISLFINIGYFINNIIFISYSEFVMIFYILICFFMNLYLKINTYLEKKSLFFAFLLIFIILTSFIFLIINIDYPKVIPYSVSADMVYLGKARLAFPIINKINFYEFFKFLLFIIYVIMSKDYFKDSNVRYLLIESIIKMYVFISVIYMLEFVLNNFVNKNIFCDFVNNIFGIYDYRSYTEPLLRNGFYTCKGLYTEPSYITLFIPYFLIMLKRKIKNIYDFIFFLLCITSVIISGSSSMLVIVPMALFCLFVGLGIGINKKKQIIKLLLFVLCFFALGCLIFKHINLFESFIDYSMLKIRSYLNGNDTSLSGSIRNYANLICYNAFLKKPLLGLGIGTIKGYGIIPGMLSSMGLLGTIVYIEFMTNIFGLTLRIKWNVIIIFIIVVYFITILSIFYIYTPAILTFVLPLKMDTRSVRKIQT
ncbi:hypothetical protein [Thomasclavelia sp.]|uniref:hypothetical protein n=1 Tax=Thomasclavelia sp. TaxID=3025757 RepID=UPI0025CDBF5F|nr:hypothetical protein [Thomasclavelia sp.]